MKQYILLFFIILLVACQGNNKPVEITSDDALNNSEKEFVLSCPILQGYNVSVNTSMNDDNLTNAIDFELPLVYMTYGYGDINSFREFTCTSSLFNVSCGYRSMNYFNCGRIDSTPTYTITCDQPYSKKTITIKEDASIETLNRKIKNSIKNDVYYAYNNKMEEELGIEPGCSLRGDCLPISFTCQSEKGTISCEGKGDFSCSFV